MSKPRWEGVVHGERVRIIDLWGQLRIQGWSESAQSWLVATKDGQARIAAALAARLEEAESPRRLQGFVWRPRGRDHRPHRQAGGGAGVQGRQEMRQGAVKQRQLRMLAEKRLGEARTEIQRCHRVIESHALEIREYRDCAYINKGDGCKWCEE